jgi:hypothetical protein
MALDGTPPRHIEVDDRFLTDWVEFGLRQLSDYLGKHARFDAFCDRREHPCEPA